MESETAIQLTSRTINVLVVVDTEYVIKTYGPNREAADPQPVGHDQPVMICAGSRGDVSEQGAGKLKFKANVGDIVSITGASIYGNSTDAVIMYSMQPVVDGHVFDCFKQQFVVRKGAAQPNPDSPTRNGLPAIENETNFSSFTSTIRARGLERLKLAFALYTLSPDGQSQDVFGYYFCDPVVMVG